MMTEALKESTDILNEMSDVRNPLDCLGHSIQKKEEKDIFAPIERKAWHQGHSDLARCDLKYRITAQPRGGALFFSIYKKSLYGRLLTEIKEDDKMVDLFAEEMAETIQYALGKFLSKGQWAIVTAPKRRHLKRNFASLICTKMSDLLHIPFYEDILHCKSKHRVGAVFTCSQVPKEHNIIVFDDIVTTGSTLGAIKNCLEQFNKNMVFFTAINNKL